MAPSCWYSPGQSITLGEQVPIPGLLLSERGHSMSIHFVGYPTLAAIPFVILDRIGVNPCKACQVVNYLPLLALAAACYLLLGSALHAWTAMVLFVLCGALPCLNWTSPEVFTMASLLAGLNTGWKKPSCRTDASGVIVTGLAVMPEAFLTNENCSAPGGFPAFPVAACRLRRTSARGSSRRRAAACGC